MAPKIDVDQVPDGMREVKTFFPKDRSDDSGLSDRRGHVNR
jgi:hypothetical protein